jgi:hypothetical protein
MKKTILPIAILLLSLHTVKAQNVAINGTGAVPDASAMLDISSTSSGLLVPRVALTAANAASPVTSPVTSLLVYNTATAGTIPNAVIPGYYYWDGAKWLAFGGSGGKDWALLGNAGTAPSTNFLGTTDANALAFRTNNTEHMRVLATGQVAINSTTTFGASTFFSAATGNNNAVDGSAAGTGSAIYGQNTGAGGYGVSGLANGTGGLGVVGQQLLNTGTAGVFISNNLGSYSTLSAGSGVAGSGVTTGVYGYAITTVAGTTASGGYFATAQTGTPFAYVGARIAGTVYKIYGLGTVSTIVKRPDGRRATMFCPEAAEPLLQDFGTGKLVNGKVHIGLDPILSNNIAVDETHPLRVFVQLKGDCKGVYVTNETANGFDVIELQGGSSSVEFSWSVTANRKDEIELNGEKTLYQDVRFPEGPGPQELNSGTANQELKK